MEIGLKKNDVIVLKRNGVSLRCLDGVLFITQSGDQNDYILKTGGKYAVSKHGKVVIQALKPAYLQLCLQGVGASKGIGINRHSDTINMQLGSQHLLV